jgi:hypothetical protein
MWGFSLTELLTHYSWTFMDVYLTENQILKHSLNIL